MTASPRRVLHLCDNREGVVEQIAALAENLAKADWQTAIAVLGRSSATELLDAAQAEVVELGGRGRFDPIMLGRLARRLRQAPPAAIHAWGAAALMAASLTRPPSPAVPLAATFDLRDAARPWAGRLLRVLWPKLAGVVAADEPTKQWLSKVLSATTRGASPRRAPPPRAEARSREGSLRARFARAESPEARLKPPSIALMPPAPLPLPEASVSRSDALQRWNLPGDARVILTAGRLEQIAHFDEAIWCYELVRVLDPQARLVIAGEGPDRERLERFARQVSEPGCVAFVGGDRGGLATALAYAEMYWQLGPSAATPPALVQAMFAGLPIVASDAAVHLATAGQGETMAIVPQGGRAAVARATDDFFADRELSARIGDAAAEQARTRFGRQRAADALAALYDAAIA